MRPKQTGQDGRFFAGLGGFNFEDFLIGVG